MEGVGEMTTTRQPVGTKRSWHRRLVSESRARIGSGIARTSSDLASSTILTSVLGLAFWSVATRQYSAEQVGLGSAQIAAATLVATAAQLNLGVILTRYLPTAGQFSAWTLWRTYAVVLFLSVMGAALVTILGLTPGPASWQTQLLFLVAVPCLALFAIQDMALVGLGASRFVPLENLLFAVAKVALLPMLAVSVIVSGVFLAWIIPALVAVAVVSAAVWRRLLPLHVAGSTASIPLPPRPALWRMVAWQYLASLTTQAYKSGLPLVIASVAGLQANGHFTVPWMIFISFAALIINVVVSFQYHTRRGEVVTTGVFRSIVAILGAVAGLGSVVVVVAAPLILRLVAASDDPASVGLLRLLGAAIPMVAAWTFYLAFIWLETRLARLALYDGLVSAAVLALTIVAVRDMGVIGAGWAVLVTFTVAGLLGCVGLRRRWHLVVTGRGDWTRD